MEPVEVLQASAHIWRATHSRFLNDGCCSQRQAARTHERWEEQGEVIPGRVLGHTSLAGRQDTLQNVASDDTFV